MKEKPILFSGEMVRVILDGRKTQTRIIVAPSNSTVNGWPSKVLWPNLNLASAEVLQKNSIDLVFLGENAPRDVHLSVPEILDSEAISRVRSKWEEGDRLWVKETFLNAALDGYDPFYLYRADGDMKPDGVNWKPSIFCSRKASRITLEIKGVRVDRLQCISESDAEAEGMAHWDGTLGAGSAGTRYAKLWEDINGKGSWGKNPWVWVIEFKKL